jgi:scyllo-inositol 2-dehydrogenase (NAD+)
MADLTGNESRLRAALIGCGRIGAHTPERLRQTMVPGWIPVSHVEAVRATPGLELVAVCDTQETAARRTAEELSVPAWFTDYRELISKARPDIVSIATRTEGRCDIVEYCAQHGVRGLHVEKPLGRSLNECRRAIRAVEQSGTIVSYGTTRRCMDVFQLVKQLVKAGENGELKHLTIELGRAALLWSHPHSFDLMVWFAGGRAVEFVQAACSFEASAWQEPTLDADPMIESAVVRFAGGFNAVITSAPGLNVRLAGDHGCLTIGADGAWLTRELRTHADRPYFSAPELIRFTPKGSGTQHAFHRLAAAVRGTGKPAITPAEVLLSNQLGLACAWSAVNDGRKVKLEDVPEDLTVTGRQGQNFA